MSTSQPVHVVGIGAPVADPIHAAIACHLAAYTNFQVAPAGDASLEAADAYDDATAALVETPCGTRVGALALLNHLRWRIADEAEFKDSYQPFYAVAEARASDLGLLFGPPPAPALAAPINLYSVRRIAAALSCAAEAIALVVFLGGFGAVLHLAA